MSWLRTAANAPASTANTRNAGVDPSGKDQLVHAGWRRSALGSGVFQPGGLHDRSRRGSCQRFRGS